MKVQRIKKGCYAEGPTGTTTLGFFSIVTFIQSWEASGSLFFVSGCQCLKWPSFEPVFTEVIKRVVVKKTAEGKFLPGVQYLQTWGKPLLSITHRSVCGSSSLISLFIFHTG